VVDHINGDTLDNRRENLRNVTSRENSAHRVTVNRNSLSGIPLVKKSKNGRWKAFGRKGGSRYEDLGTHGTAEEAQESIRIYESTGLKSLWKDGSYEVVLRVPTVGQATGLMRQMREAGIEAVHKTFYRHKVRCASCGKRAYVPPTPET
jgi:hypothetical protein